MSDNNKGNLLSSVMPDPFDVRTRKRNITRGVITREDIENHLDKLPDDHDNAEVVGYDDLLNNNVLMEEHEPVQATQGGAPENLPNVVPVLDLPPGLLSGKQAAKAQANPNPEPPAPATESFQHESIIPSSSTASNEDVNSPLANNDSDDESSPQ